MYSDEYVNEDNEVVTTSSGNGDNKIKLIVCGVLALVIIILLIFALKGKGGSSSSGGYTVKISPENEVVISVGSTYNLTATIKNSKGKNIDGANARWSVDNADIVSVDNGTVKGINYGKAIVTAIYVADNGKSFQDTKEITVAEGDSNVALTGITVLDGDLYLPVNDSYQISVGLTPNNAYVSSRTFTSSNESVAMVDDTGLVNAIGEGETTINIVVNNNYRESVKVVVKSDIDSPTVATYPTAVTIDNSVTSIKVGETTTLNYSIEPAGAQTDKLKWSSSDPSILSVDNNGNITAVAEGTAEITLSSENNVENKMTITVVSADIPVTSIDYITPDITIILNQPELITPTITPAEATNKTLQYTILDTTMVTLNPSADTQSVELTGLRVGTTKLTITASNGVSKEFNVIVENAPSSGSCGSCSKVTCSAGNYCSCGKCYACKAGYVCKDNKRTACPQGYYCPGGSVQYHCPDGKSTKKTGAKSVDDCTVEICKNGTYGTAPNCTTCEKGYYCFGGQKYACPDGRTTDTTGATSAGRCTVNTTGSCERGQYMANQKCFACQKGYWCDGKEQHQCTAGTTTLGTGAKYSTDCKASNTKNCDAGYYLYGSSCVICPQGSVCFSNQKYSCPSGTTTFGKGAQNFNECNVKTNATAAPTTTPKATATPKASATSTPSATNCRAGTYPKGSKCEKCDPGYYCLGGSSQPIICPAGKYCVPGSASPKDCPTGQTCGGTGVAYSARCGRCS